MKVVIIGAGIAGLAASALLAREGHDVVVLEGRNEVGGRAGSWEAEGFRFDTGPSWYLMPEVFDHFYRLLGTSADEQLHLVTLDPGYRVYFQGHEQPVEIMADVEDNVALFESIERGAGEQLLRYLASAEETYRLALNSFLYTTFSDLRPVANRDVLARAGKFTQLLTESLATLVDRTVYDRRLRQILGFPAVFLGASPYIAPSMYHLMSALDLQGGVQYPMGGFVRIIDSIAALARAEGVDIRTGSPVRKIIVEQGTATSVEYLAGGTAIEFEDADIVVSAADLHHTETQLLDEEYRSYPQKYWDSHVPGPSALLLMLGVKGELPELEHHTLLFAKDWKKGFNAIFRDHPTVPQPASLYICKPSGVDPDVAPDGHENVFVLVPIPADPSIGHGEVGGDGDPGLEKLADRIIEQISEWAGIPDLADRIVLRRTVGPGDFADDFNSWRGTALGPAHTLRQSAMFRPGNRSRKVKGLYYAGGSTIPGIGLPMCLISAELLVKRLRGDTSTLPLAEPLGSPRKGAPLALTERVAPEVVEETVLVELEEAADYRAELPAARRVVELDFAAEPVEVAAVEVEPEAAEVVGVAGDDVGAGPADSDHEDLEDSDAGEAEDDELEEAAATGDPVELLPERDPAALEPLPITLAFTDLAARAKFGAARWRDATVRGSRSALKATATAASTASAKAAGAAAAAAARAKALLNRPAESGTPAGPARLRDSGRWPKPLESAPAFRTQAGGPADAEPPAPEPVTEPRQPEFWTEDRDEQGQPAEPEPETEPESAPESDPFRTQAEEASDTGDAASEPEADELQPEFWTEDRDEEPENREEPEEAGEPEADEREPEELQETGEPEAQMGQPDDPMARARATLERLRAFRAQHDEEAR